MISANRWGFNGKEKQVTQSLNYLDYGARMYDDFVGRWFTQDLLAEKYYSVSGYVYCLNSPVKYIDPDGRSVWGFLKGLGQGAWNSVKNTWNFVTSDAWKSSTWKGIGNLALGAVLSVGNPNSAEVLVAVDNALGTNTYEAVSSTKESIKNTVEKIASGDSEAIGEAIGDIAVTAALTKGISSAVSKAEKLSGAAVKAGEAAETGAKLSSNGVKLSKQLASEAQMTEKGSTIIPSVKLKEAARLAEQYGGNASDWVKKSSSSFTKNGASFETHWYENIVTGTRTEFKTKFP